MKNKIKRLSLFFIAVAIIATIVVPERNSTYAATGYIQKKITIYKSAKQVVDSFNGVHAYYRKGGNDGSNSFYSCAAFVKRYYKTVYHRDVNNLLHNRTPLAKGDSFVKVTSPQVGDIVATNTNHGTTHWAIAKSINEDGTITLIEQNWKWRQGGGTKSVLNRKIKVSRARYYRLKSETRINAVALSVSETSTLEETSTENGTATEVTESTSETDADVAKILLD